MTREGSGHLSSNSLTFRPVTGSLVSGAMAARGSRTNLLSLKRGWGRMSQGVWRTHSPCMMMSRSMVLWPPEPLPVRPRALSVSWSLVRRVKGERGVWTRATPFMNQGWGSPTGSLRNQGETCSIRICPDSSLARAARQLASLDPILEPTEM